MGRVETLIQSTKDLKKLAAEAFTNTPTDNIRCIEAFDQLIFYTDHVMKHDYQQRFPKATMKELLNFMTEVYRTFSKQDWVALHDFIWGEILNYCDAFLALFEKLKGVSPVRA